LTIRHRDAIGGKQLFCLIFVKIHGGFRAETGEKCAGRQQANPTT